MVVASPNSAILIGTLELRFKLRYAETIHSEEQKPLEEFFQAKGLKTRNEMLEDVSSCSLIIYHANHYQSSALIQAALNDADINSSEEEVVAARADRGSADEDSESDDEDFQSGSDSDVAEEFDEDHVSSGSGSDEEMVDAKGGDEDERAAEPKKKKTKISK